MSQLHGDWTSVDDVIRDFEITEKDLEGKTIVTGYYQYENYEGDAWVLLRDDATAGLEQVTGGHCSCYGLEGQWSPEPVSVDELIHYLREGKLLDPVKAELAFFLCIPL